MASSLGSGVRANSAWTAAMEVEGPETGPGPPRGCCCSLESTAGAQGGRVLCRRRHWQRSGGTAASDARRRPAAVNSHQQASETRGSRPAGPGSPGAAPLGLQSRRAWAPLAWGSSFVRQLQFRGQCWAAPSGRRSGRWRPQMRSRQQACSTLERSTRQLYRCRAPNRGACKRGEGAQPFVTAVCCAP